MMRKLLRGLLVFCAVLVVGFVVLYVATSGVEPVMPTVVDDPSLPAIDVGGLRLHAEVFGPDDAPVVVILHGGPGNDYRMLLSLKALADEYRVVFYDQRGAGLSQRVSADRLELDDYLTELGAVIERFGRGRPVHIVGHSWGAMLAAAYVTRHPEMVTSIVLAEPGFLDDEGFRSLMQRTDGMQPALSAGLLVHVLLSFFESLHVTAVDADARMDDLLMRITTGDPDLEGHPIAGYFCGGDLRNASWDMWRLGSTAMFAAQRSADAEGHLRIQLIGERTYAGPVLFLTSACNVLFGEKEQRRNMKYFPGARMKIVADAGHTLFGEKPDETTVAVRAFLAETGTSTTARPADW